ncbi:GntR family transcriptional regulator [Acidaminobacter sp. JC074]|uniref:GntR family transcriptional regulator n=1 Tax=Acidaminobacter sp. JC074 TaxID=2530199 RepID=UPI001F0DFF83|nr:GntR family transcriptional regulator [Acidaminobacter sp. JC074]MCH4886677.1 GntR family transcriptional regulator [Acidaminobacter sp. JC074]
MLLAIDMNSETPIYTQLCRQIIKAIATKELQEGDELPSVRSLAADIGVNLHTVNKAYNILKADGFLVVNRRKGVVVSPSTGYTYNENYLQALKNELESVVIEALARHVSDDQLTQMVHEIVQEVRGD